MSSEKQDDNMMHVAMCPWFGFSHLKTFLHLANKLAQHGHTISFFLPAKTQSKLASLNLHPNLISFVPITLPDVEGLPNGAETTNDVPRSALSLLMAAIDLAEPTYESYFTELKPDFVFFDFVHWLPRLARKYQSKPVYFASTYVSFLSYLSPKARAVSSEDQLDETELREAPPGFPREFRLKPYEARKVVTWSKREVGIDRVSFFDKALMGIRDCDAVCYKSCREIEGEFGDYFEKVYQKPILWTGLLVAEVPGSMLDEQFNGWLKGFDVGSVVYCAIGSEIVLGKDQFQELVLGLEQTGSSLSAPTK